jgi:hypothetical protein
MKVNHKRIAFDIAPVNIVLNKVAQNLTRILTKTVILPEKENQ